MELSTRDYVIVSISDADMICECCRKNKVVARVVFPTNDTVYRCRPCYYTIRAGSVIEWKGEEKLFDEFKRSRETSG